MCDQRANSDVAIAEIAARQHGVIAVRQLRDAGLDKHRVRHRVRTGRLHPIHRGVYAVGHEHFSQESRWMAAVLAGGKGAVVSHRSAASLWGLLPDPTASRVEISVPGDGGRSRRAGILVHRRSSLRPGCITCRRGIPVTTPARTLADLRPVASPVELRRIVRQAAVLGLSIGSEVRHDETRSELESRFLALCRRHRLPAPAVNVRIGAMTVDFLWPDNRLVVETDGYRYHRGRAAFEDDRDRDLRLRALGYDVIRLSYHQVVKRPGETAAVLRQALGA
jgi:very-short-patch-repair endonuclease